MKFIFGVFIFSLMIFSIFAQDPCSTQKSCKTCVAQNNCGWCGPVQQCFSGNQYGPTNATCIGTAWQFQNCTDCSALPDCRSCLDYAADCFWCQQPNTTAACYRIGDKLGCPYTKSCPCNNYPTCTSCLYESRGDCSWCGNDKTCRKSTDPSCLLAHTCPCEENADCTACSTTAGCYWCVSDGSCKKLGSSSCPIPLTGCDGYCQQAGGAGCSSCQALRGCGWCLAEGTCRDINYATCNLATNCLNCGAFQSCETCFSASGCGWCSDSKSCQSLQTATCFFAHTCSAPTKSGGFSGSSFVGGMFLVIGILCLAMVAYFVYKWKVNKHATYTELK